MRSNVLATLVGGLTAGALDLTYAIVFSGLHAVPALRILQSVASGLLGASAYEGGLRTAALGTLLHFLIALAAAATYVVASGRVGWLRERPLIAGMAFGLAMYVVMTFAVLPLSAYPHPLRFTPLLVTANVLAHMFLFGVPVAFAARRFGRVAPGAGTLRAPAS
jgi:hypothetical protein